MSREILYFILLLACYVRLRALDAFKKLNVFGELDGLNIYRRRVPDGAGLCRGDSGARGRALVTRAPVTARLGSR